ncbi:PREDICTED: uncharacterized protein LOC108780076 [Cyphomyrmex costatus]|uniref:uncharacterized protein LOC108780076 n=1 Tax=Cyphomyrmex costatus TaxID=456900 RepID=UPI000852287D|nr:PREDICTED: uncharacterized protein LOC108780076 [Cyphomyrmex costatus]
MNNQNLSRKSALRSLTPFLDKQGLIRVGGRLRYADLSQEQKHPIVLSSKHNLTLSIMREEHKRMLHCPPEQLLYSVRSMVPDICMGDLSKERVTILSRPFMVTGVDPLQIRESRRRGRIHVSKEYIAVFVCFSSKAVHLEIVTSLTTEAFLAALSRFTARRGLCAQLFSDNGTNFVGAVRDLREIQEFLENSEPDIMIFLAKQKINWSFNPPRSLHFGDL